jgi:hypothetical protein
MDAFACFLKGAAVEQGNAVNTSEGRVQFRFPGEGF